jgi:hypothetical protein
MSKTGLAYERPSRVSLALIVCFSCGLIVMAGWLAMTILFSSNANTAAGPTDGMMASLPPHVENATPPYVPPVTVEVPLSAASQPGIAPPQASAYGGGPPDTGPTATIRAYTTSALASGTALHGPGDLVLQIEPQPASEPTEIVPLPSPRPPRRVAAVPVPRPRPQIDDAEPPPPPQERSLLDIFINRQ